MDDLNVIKTVAECGSIGVTILIVILGYRLACRFETMMSNHFMHFTEALNGLINRIDLMLNHHPEDKE